MSVLLYTIVKPNLVNVWSYISDIPLRSVSRNVKTSLSSAYNNQSIVVRPIWFLFLPISQYLLHRMSIHLECRNLRWSQLVVTHFQLAVRKKTNVRFDISCVEWVPWDERVASFYKRLIPKISNLTFVFITYSQLLKRLVDQVATSLDTGKHPTYVPNVCSLSTLTLFYEGGGQFCPTSKSYSHNFTLSKVTQKRYQMCARNLFS